MADNRLSTFLPDDKAAFGVFPQMKPRRRLQDPEAAANVPLSVLRGYAAGTAGLPGDIEGLARAGLSQLPPQLLTAFPALRAFGIGSRADPTPQLPTTEFYNEYLPGASLNETPTGKAFTTAGNLLGGVGSTNIAGLGVKGAKATGQALGPTVGRMAEGYLQRTGGILPLDVYHGTPHTFPPTARNPLGEFDASKIGSGEGAQAYGHGIYTAEAQNTGRRYQMGLTQGLGQEVLYKDKSLNDLYSQIENKAIKLSGKAADIENQKLQLVEHMMLDKSPQELVSYARETGFDPSVVKWMETDVTPNIKIPGSLYKVDLPDEQIAKMLDWDKPLTEQEMIGIYDKMQQSPLASFAKPFQENFYSAMERGQKTPDGQDLFMELSKQLGGQKYVSEALRELGIPGIKYLDEGSRGASGTGKWKLKFPSGEEKIYDFKPDDDVLKMMNATAEPHVTRNFVTFPGEEKNLTILERNGQPSQNSLNSFIR